MGHEGCGEILDIDPDAMDLGFQMDDLIAIFSASGCGKEDCSECSRGLPEVCQNTVVCLRLDLAEMDSLHRTLQSQRGLLLRCRKVCCCAT